MNKISGKSSAVSATQTDDGYKDKPSMSNISIKYSSRGYKPPTKSLINYANFESAIFTAVSRLYQRESLNMSMSRIILEAWEPKQAFQLLEKFPINVTSLMNEENKWGCFYNFPEIYKDEYSPVFRVRELEDVPQIEGGVLTRDLVTACLSYLKRTPILGDFALIKLDLPLKELTNIDVLKHYKFLVYLDLSQNLLKELTVLAYLPYLQHLTVSFNRLCTILEYDTPQWFLTEVHYKFNSVKKINDLSLFWSITVLDLSHNNIKYITGLQQLRYLRRLDLSFNHIQRLENLNHLRLVWLDISYNNISTCEFDDNSGLWTLLHLQYLNLNENNLMSLKMFSGCNRIRELYLRNNRLAILLELAVYMKQMRRLVVLDFRANPLCGAVLYKDVVINTFPLLLNLDATELDPVQQRNLKMEMNPDVTAHATRRLLRMLYIQQLSRSLVSPFIPPADTTDVPLVVIVGMDAIGKGTLARRLTSECTLNTQLARQHTTAESHLADHFIEVTRSKFDAMLLAGEFLTYTEMDGESYGLSREEAYVMDGRVRIVNMDLVGALMLKLRGYRPYLILATIDDKRDLAKRQFIRKTLRENYRHQTGSAEAPTQRSTLQVLVSGRIIITGILNEIILNIPDVKTRSEFAMESECSLLLDSDVRQTIRNYAKNPDFINMMTASELSLQEASKRVQDGDNNNQEPSLYSLFKESQGTEEYTSCLAYGQDLNKKGIDRPSASQPSNRYTSSTWKGLSTGKMDSTKSTKSVTFTSQDAAAISPTGILIESTPVVPEAVAHSVSTRGPLPAPGQHMTYHMADSDLWLAFLSEAVDQETSDTANIADEPSNIRDPEFMMPQISCRAVPVETIESLEALETLTSGNLREQYESIHRRNPGLFYDTVTMDNIEEAYKKMRRILRDIVDNQSVFLPMFDIDFPNLSDYPSVQKRLERIRQEIAPQQLFK